MNETCSNCGAEYHRIQDHCCHCTSLFQQLAASQAREVTLREGVLNTANACRIWGGEAERARKMLEHYLAITDSTQSP